MKHSLSGSRSRRRRYHGNNPNPTPNTSHRPLQDRKARNNCPPISPRTPTPQPQAPHSLTLYGFDDYDTFTPSSSAPSLLRRTINRIRLVLGTLLLVPGILILAPSELFDFDDFLFYFKKGTLPLP